MEIAMPVIADTTKLVADGVLSRDQARIIEERARETMVSLAINTVLCFGIVAATVGTVGYLADAVAVAVLGVALLAGGLLTLAKADAKFHMFGNAATLIGAGMLIGGSSLQLLDNYEDVAGLVMLAGGAIVALIAGRSLVLGGLSARFVAGTILLMGVALHLSGLGFLLFDSNAQGPALAMAMLYTAIVIAASGWATNVRFITALAIFPFSAMLDASTSYAHATYSFFSGEPTLSILQMSALVAAALWLARNSAERLARHARILATLGFVVANLCALVGSLWGDVVGATFWGDSQFDETGARIGGLVISANVYTVLWALALAGMIYWAAHRSNRALFNAAVTFGAIHAYTQIFESFFDEPLAYAIGGFAAIPLAWGMWRLNQWFQHRNQPTL
jgi:hypothetical protein